MVPFCNKILHINLYVAPGSGIGKAYVENLEEILSFLPTSLWCFFAVLGFKINYKLRRKLPVSCRRKLYFSNRILLMPRDRLHFPVFLFCYNY